MSLCRSILSFFESSFTNRSKGFTLVEVLVSISIFSLAIASIYGVFTSISATKDRLDLNSEAYHQARVVLDRIGREIHGIYINKSAGANILKGGFNEKGQVFFELSTTAAVATQLNEAGFVSVRYELVEDHQNDDEGFVLMRTEKPLSGSLSLEDFPAMRMASGIKSFTARYFSEDSWRDQWDQKLQGFPDLLEIMITEYDKNGEETPFLTAFKLPVNGSRQ